VTPAVSVHLWLASSNARAGAWPLWSKRADACAQVLYRNRASLTGRAQSGHAHGEVPDDELDRPWTFFQVAGSGRVLEHDFAAGDARAQPAAGRADARVHDLPHRW
jgi:hypothetical protein